ncbi:ribulose-phosphate 3-epimerase [Chloroflexota bacterium]
MRRPVRVVPAILTDDSEALEKMVRNVETFTDFVQIDIMDNKFVPSGSVGYEQVAAVAPKLDWEAHIMVLNPEQYVEGFKKAGAGKIVFHLESTTDPVMVISRIRQAGLQAGLAVNPESTLEKFIPLVDKVDSLLFLTVHPGFYGAKFLPDVLDKVAEFRKRYPAMEIGVDGGIKEGNVVQIAGMGVDVICVGSAINLAPSPGDVYRRLLTLAQEGSRLNSKH